MSSATTILSLLLSATRVATWGQGVRAALARLAMSFFLLSVATVLVVAGIAFGCYAGFVALAHLLPPASAAAIVAAGMLIAAAGVTALALRRPRPRSPRAASGAHAAPDATEALAGLAGSVNRWMHANPGQAMAAAFTIGVAVGSRRKGPLG
jgi:hypothetical protein